MNRIVKTGETPGYGTYSCTNCGTNLDIGKTDTVPPCPKCSNNEFTKISD